jgi:hypothetical protein
MVQVPPSLSLSLLPLFLILSRTSTQHGAAIVTPTTMNAVQYDKYGGGAEGLKVRMRDQLFTMFSCSLMKLCR